MNNNVKTSLFLAGISIVLMIIGWLIARHAGLFIGFLFALLMDIVAYYYSDVQMLGFFHAKELQSTTESELTSIVKTLSEKACIPTPKIYIIDSNVPNAFSTGRNPKSASIVATKALITLLNQDELTAVITYEIIRIQNQDTWMDSVSASLGTIIMKLCSVSAWFGINRADLQKKRSVGSVFLAPFSAGLIRMMSSRRRDFQADKMAAELCGNVTWLTSALKKLEEHKAIFPAVEMNPSAAHLFIIDPLKTDKINALFSVQSLTADRILHLEQVQI